MSSDTVATADMEALLTSITNHVALAGNNVSIEMLQLAAEMYGPDLASYTHHDLLVFENPSGNNTGEKVSLAPQTRGWHPVAASELSDMPAVQGPTDPHNPLVPALQYSFVGGQYQAIDFSKPYKIPFFGNVDYAEANALVLTGLVHDTVSGTDKRTLVLAIRGTDQAADAVLDYESFGTHYDKFAPLVAALHTYLAANPDGIQQILISGHSLGAGVVPYFLQAFPDTASYTVRAYVDGPPGSEVDPVDSRIVNFVHAGMMFPAAGDHAGDNVPILGEVTPYPHGDYANVGNGQTGKDFIDGILNNKNSLSLEHSRKETRRFEYPD